MRAHWISAYYTSLSNATRFFGEKRKSFSRTKVSPCFSALQETLDIISKQLLLSNGLPILGTVKNLEKEPEKIVNNLSKKKKPDYLNTLKLESLLKCNSAFYSVLVQPYM